MNGHRHAIMSPVALCIMYVVFTGLVFNAISLYAFWVDADGTVPFASYLNMISVIGTLFSRFSLPCCCSRERSLLKVTSNKKGVD